MNHQKLNPSQWNSELQLKPGMVVIFENGYYQSLNGKNLDSPQDNQDFVYLGEVQRFTTFATRNAINIDSDNAINWRYALNIYNKTEVDNLLQYKADLVNGLVPANQLPSYVDDVIDGYYKEADGKFYEEVTFETQILGESGKIYLDLGTDSTFRWNGTLFVKIGGGGSNIQIGLAAEKSGINGYTIVNSQLSILGFYSEEFEYAFTENPANPGLNIPTISLKNKYLQEPSLANLNIPVWNLTTKSFDNSTLQYDGMTVQVGPLQNLPGVSFAVNGSDKGSIPVPRMTQAQRVAIPNLTVIQAGMTIFQTDGASGYYYWSGAAWVKQSQNIMTDDLTNTAARVQTQGQAFTWNTAGFFYYLKGLLDKTGNAAYTKVLVVHPTTGEKVTRDFADPQATTLAVQNASTAQKTAMRTALLGTATPANPVLQDTNVRFVTRGIQMIDLYGINLTLLDPTFLWIEKVDGTKIYATNFYNLTGTAFTSVWDLPADLPNGDYDIKIQNGVTVQGLSNAKITVVDSIAQTPLLNADWKMKLRMRTDGTEAPLVGSRISSADNRVYLSGLQIQGYDAADPLTWAGVIFKSQNIFLGNKDWDITLDITFEVGSTNVLRNVPFIGLTETNHSEFVNTASIINNKFIIDQIQNIKLSETAPLYGASTGTGRLYISKVGDKLFYRLFKAADYTNFSYFQTSIDITKNYALFIRDNSVTSGAWSQRTVVTTARIMN